MQAHQQDHGVALPCQWQYNFSACRCHKKWIRLIIISDSQSCNDTSNVVYLQDGNAPLFTNVPSNMAGCLNQDVSIDVEVQSSPVATYQWFGPNGLIVGEESESLNLTNIQLSDEGLYYIVATNNCGTTTSENIYLDVLGNIIYPTTIVGDNTICHGVTTSQYSTDGDNLSQTWHISPVSAGTINDGLVVWNPDFMRDATIFVQTTACNAPPMALETVVSVIPSVETPTISGPSVHCVGAGTNQYTATAQGDLRLHGPLPMLETAPLTITDLLHGMLISMELQ